MRKDDVDVGGAEYHSTQRKLKDGGDIHHHLGNFAMV